MTNINFTKGHQEIVISSATGDEPWFVNTIDDGVPHKQPVQFSSLAQARAFAESFDADELSIRIGGPLPPLSETMS
jgi:hypothetical protein